MDYSKLLNMRNSMGNTKLNSMDEMMFQQWHEGNEALAGRAGLNHDADDPGHLYDYRGQFKAGVPYQQDPEDMTLHGDSRFKKEGHGRSIVDTPSGLLNTKTGARFGHLFDR